jgi:hypothetical protein
MKVHLLRLSAALALAWLYWHRGESPAIGRGVAFFLHAALIFGWLQLAAPLWRFIDRRNVDRRIQAFSGFLAMIVAMFGVAWLSFSLKSPSAFLDFATSFRRDGAWLILIPLTLHYGLSRQMANPAATAQRGEPSVCGRSFRFRRSVLARPAWVT